jgi:predicted RNase H-like HicB family nuclease
MHYTAVVTKEGKQTLADFPGCPGCQTFADPGEDIAERAEEALVGWLEANLASGQAPSEPKKNFLFVGHEQAGQNLADLYSLVATCMANGRDPLAYLTDILGRIGSHPAARLDDLLPQNWSPPA